MKQSSLQPQLQENEKLSVKKHSEFTLERALKIV